MTDFKVVLDKETGIAKKVPLNQSDDKIEVLAECPMTTEQLAKIHNLSKQELVDIVLRYARQCGIAACQTPKETAQAVLDRLAEIALVRASNGEEKALRDVISAVNSWLDRVEGRPKQTIDANVNMGVVQLFQAVKEKRDKERLEIPVIEN